ncbi:MAG: hypothetical protein ACJ8AT_09615 [Hyalangium sp.]|uniref:hypothetical protein n=1 Tax=Hyalangium sp. TaxID=2028555 RepID=UPI00389A6BC1
MSPPDFLSLRAGGPGCPSELTLDRLHAGELSRELAQRTTEHVAGCAGCQARMAERRAGFDALDGVDARVMLGRIRSGLDKPAPLPERLWGLLRRLSLPLTAVAAAAIVLLLVRPGEEPAAPGTRLKGSPTLHVFRLRGDHAEEVLSGEPFAPGDRLRFTVDLGSEGYVKVLGVEASGALYTAWPLDSGVQTRMAAGHGIELPGAVALDAQPGRETLYLVHCPLAVGPPACTSTGPEARPVCPEPCTLTPFVLRKGP